MRLMSRVIARCNCASRGCAARVTRWSALLSAATSGSTLPVNWACCCARRIADSMSTTRFSSRERDRLWIRSSSWVRCNATSLNLTSDSASRAAVSRVSSWAWRARVRASSACTPESALCRASCSRIADRRCHNSTLMSRASKASARVTHTSTGGRPGSGGTGVKVAPAAAVCTPVPASGDSCTGGSTIMRWILSMPPHPERWAVTPIQHQIRPPGPRLRCAHGLPVPGPRPNPDAAGRIANWPPPGRS